MSSVISTRHAYARQVAHAIGPSGQTVALGPLRSTNSNPHKRGMTCDCAPQRRTLPRVCSRHRGVMLKLRTSLCSLLLLCLVAPVMQAQEDARLREHSRRLAGSIMTANSLDAVRHLTDTIGPRLVGSPEYERAARWAASQLRESGIRIVRVESYEIPNGWQRIAARSRSRSKHAVA
jgi:hypothetical protein